MQTKDWPVVKEAKKMAEHQLEFYDEMMERKVVATKPERNPSRILSDQTDGLHIYPEYARDFVHKRMHNMYIALTDDHTCPICGLKT